MRPNRLSLMTMLLLAAPLAAQQPIDSVYSARIKELTPTDAHWKFTTELVETLPASSTVPTPLKVNGYVPGTIGKLSHVAELNKYFKAIADASPRAKLYSFGMSDEGREMIGLVIADEATIQNIEQYRADLAKLADPRGVSAAEKVRLIHSDVEMLRLHYAYTLREWLNRFIAGRDKVLALYDERFFRMWEFYLAGGVVMFESGAACNYQIQYIRDRNAVPITRDYMAEAEARYRKIKEAVREPEADER